MIETEMQQEHHLEKYEDDELFDEIKW